MRKLKTAERRFREPAQLPFGSGKKLSGRRVQSWKRRLVVLTLIIWDVLLAYLIWTGAAAIHSAWGSGQLTDIATVSIIPDVAVWLGLRALFGLYPGYGLDPVEELRRQSYAVAATLAVATTLAVVLKIGDEFSRLLLVVIFLGLALLAPLMRQLVKQGIRWAGSWGKPVAIVRAGEGATHVIRTLQGEWGLGLNPVAVFDDRRDAGEESFEGVPYSGKIVEAEKWAWRHGVDTVIMAISRGHDTQLPGLADWASISFRSVIVIPNLGGVMHSAVVARDLAGTLGVEIKHNLLDPWSRRLKRTLDLFGAVVGGLFISPFLLALVLLIKLDSPGPAIYGQQRLGTGNRSFHCLKFRTMRLDAEQALDKYLHGNPDLRAEWENNHKLQADPRVTRIGHFLRATSLDELPQLWNVLRGEMSLVGPRPIVDAEVVKYGNVYELYKRVTPGISGFWQVSGRSDTSYEERVSLDAYYVRNWSVWLDLVILARTVSSVLFRRGAR